MEEINRHIETILTNNEFSLDTINESIESLERIINSSLASAIEFNKKLRSQSAIFKQFCNMELLVIALGKCAKRFGLGRIRNILNLLLKGILS